MVVISAIKSEPKKMSFCRTIQSIFKNFPYEFVYGLKWSKKKTFTIF